ncbi:electron transport complex subunit RsxG [Methylophaga sp.]|uniref:electron transport complex subunit RsxG n=1 Tax=Methylophaga sp. TaxID=2024840 RepID=UPI002718F133|nr:electron transport complex subunit RsxG [Methylophaga sp.]MDO8828046.1 electron transport complex subunit RsxG [Methylophaga sp.]
MSKLAELKSRVSYQGLLLGGFALLASALLGFADYNTRDEINLRMEEDLRASLAQVIPQVFYDNDLLAETTYIDARGANLGSDQVLVYLARKNGKVNAVSFRLVAADGYSGAISLIMGIDKEGNVLGVRVLSHAETPGLGDKIEENKSNWILSFNNRSLDNLTKKQWTVKKDGGEFDQFSGATITPRAIVHAVYRGLEFFKRHQVELLAS